TTRPQTPAEIPTDRMAAAQAEIDTNRSMRRARPAALLKGESERRAYSPSAQLAAKASPAVKPANPHGLTCGRLAVILLARPVLGISLRFILSRVHKAPAEAKTLVVTRAGQPGTFPSIREALKLAQPGDRVVVAEETWEEALELRGDEGKGVAI